MRSTRVQVWRGTADQDGGFQTYVVPFEDGMSVLDALRWIRTHLDSSLAIRYSCVNANACKTCMASVNGEVEYTCIARLSEDGVRVGPIPKRPIIRDLVTDTVPADEKLPDA